MTTNEMDGVKDSDEPLMLVGICKSCKALNEWAKDGGVLLQSSRPCSQCGKTDIDPRSVTTKRTHKEGDKRVRG